MTLFQLHELQPTRLLLSVGFPRQEYCSRLPFPPPRDLPDPGIKPASPALAGGFFTIEPAGRFTMPTFFKPTTPSAPAGPFACPLLWTEWSWEPPCWALRWLEVLLIGCAALFLFLTSLGLSQFRLGPCDAIVYSVHGRAGAGVGGICKPRPPVSSPVCERVSGFSIPRIPSRARPSGCWCKR